METLDLLIKALYFILPAYIANMVLVYSWFAGLREADLGVFSKPLDLGLKLGGKPLLGYHRRLDGVIISVLVASIVVGVQRLLYPALASYSSIDYSAYNPLYLGLIFGGGCYLGGLLNSFTKRRMSIQPHKGLPVIDQIDNAGGALLLAWVFLQPPWPIIIAALVLSIPLVAGVNLLSYKLKIKDVWW